MSLDDMQLVFPDGSVIRFDDDYSIGVTPMPREANPAIITRGKHGPTHISTRPLTDAQTKEIDLWNARLNDQTAETLLSLDKTLRDVRYA